MATIIITLTISLCGCNGGSDTDMPFNGDVYFHDISITIPEDYIRDSTQSNDDFWIFEHGGYKKYIMLSIEPAEDKSLEKYAASMESVGAECEYVSNDVVDAVISRVTNKDNEYCQELYFIYKGSRYAVAARGQTDEEFMDLTDTLLFHE